MKKNTITALVIVIIGFVIAMVGLISPPLGYISNGVLIAVGEFIAIGGGFAGLVIDLDFKNLRFFVGLPEHYKDNSTSNTKPSEEVDRD